MHDSLAASITIGTQQGTCKLASYSAVIPATCPKTITPDIVSISSNPDIAAWLEEAYGGVDLIDAWVGGLAEGRFGDGLVSELFHVVIADQFDRGRAGEKYSSENNALPDIAQGIGFHILSDVIKANTGVEVIQDDVLLSYDRKGGGDGNDTVIGNLGPGPPQWR